MPGNIFNKYHLPDFVDSFRKGLSAEVDNLEITDSSDINGLIDRLKNKFTIHPLSILEPKPSQPIEKLVMKKNHWGELYEQKVFEISITIPFEGNKQLFDCHPSTSKIIFLDESVHISQTFISAKVILEDLDHEKYQKAIDKIISDLSANVPQVNFEISPWNNMLEPHVRQLVENRKNIVAKKFEFMDKIGLKVNPQSDNIIPSPITRKNIPTPVSEITHNIKKEQVPTLQEEVYRDIKEVLYNVGQAMERKPSLYLNKREEDLRDIFLLFLETRYESASGVGEAFNKKGKTDILLKYAKDGSNLFVAECKFWKGQKKLFEGIDQLLGYLTHRDSKTALMIFVDQKEFISVKQTLKIEITKHSNYIRHISDTYHSSFRYEFYLPSDSKKMIQIEMMLFHFPK